MSIESEITRINNNIAATYTALSAKGATMPETENSANLASTVATVPSGGGGDPVNKAFEVNEGVLNKPTATFSDNTFAGVTSVGSYALYYKYYCSAYTTNNTGGVINFDSVTSVGEYGLQNAFTNCNMTSVSFNSLVQLNKDHPLSNSFQNNRNLTSISFPSLNSITGSYACYYCFDKCTSLTSVDFPELETATGSSCISYFFSECTALTTASFPKLKTLGYSSCSNMFKGCTSLTTISFPSLTTVDSSGLSYCFQNCTGLTNISFPALTTVKSNSFASAFYGCKALTEIHFPAAIQSTIEGLTGYSSKFGAANATIYFDL